jgi:hypothetical protein
MDATERTATRQMLSDPTVQAADTITSKVAGMVGNAAGRTAEKVRGIASAASHAASDLETSFPHTAAYMRSTAAGINEVAEMLQRTDVDKVKNAARDLVVKQPVVFFAGIAIVGIGVWYLLSSAGDAERRISE